MSVKNEVLMRIKNIFINNTFRRWDGFDKIYKSSMLKKFFPFKGEIYYKEDRKTHNDFIEEGFVKTFSGEISKIVYDTKRRNVYITIEWDEGNGAYCRSGSYTLKFSKYNFYNCMGDIIDGYHLRCPDGTKLQYITNITEQLNLMTKEICKNTALLRSIWNPYCVDFSVKLVKKLSSIIGEKNRDFTEVLDNFEKKIMSSDIKKLLNIDFKPEKFVIDQKIKNFKCKHIS